MLPQATKPTTHSSTHSSTTEGDKQQKQLDHEVREMVSAITHRLSDLHKPGSSHNEDDGHDDHGVRLITLAGSNTGATLRTELEEKPSPLSLGDPEALSTYVNSNFQAINNSIMMGGSYTTNDPGVHMDISDFYDHQGHKHGKKGKKKEKETSKSDHHSEHSD